MSPWIYQHVPVAFFVFAFGAIVGSFINVVIYRVPAGMSVITPPSRCPTCGARLTWRENLPIIGWFLVGGRCKHCRVRISFQYVLIELTVALMFLGLYLAYYVAGPRVSWFGAIGGDWWYYNGIFRSSPMFIAHLILLAALVAMTVIDARTFTIPIQIPMVVIVVGFAAAIIQPFVTPVPRVATGWPIVVTDWQWFTVALGGMLGIGLSTTLLKLGVLRYSFADYDQYAKEGEVIADYPHARREMGVELVFLTPCLVGLVGGYLVGGWLLPSNPPPTVIQSVGGAALGYLMGGGIIWGIRIVFSFIFGKEAMGLGDVHVLAAVGTVLGWADPIFIFLLAPFSGLLWVVLSIGLSAMLKRGRRELPFGPHLAVAVLAVIVCRPVVIWVQTTYLPPGLGPPQPGLKQPIQPGP